MLQLFVTDLDGTLLARDNHIKQEDINAIDQLVKAGVAFGVATGRMDREIIKIMEIIHNNGHRISQNGSFVYDKEGTALYTETFSTTLSKQLLQAITAKTDNYYVTTATEVHVPVRTEIVKEFEKLSYFPIIESPELETLLGTTVVPSKISLYGETEELLQLKDDIGGQFEAETESYLSDPHCVDIVPKGISKAAGLSRILEKYQLNPEQVAVIGDSFNDVPMLELTPHSYAMAIAPDGVKQKANNVVATVAEAVEDLKKKELF